MILVSMTMPYTIQNLITTQAEKNCLQVVNMIARIRWKRDIAGQLTIVLTLLAREKAYHQGIKFPV